MTGRARAATIAIATVITGCTAPHAPTELGVREVPSDLVLGHRPAVLAPPAPVPPAVLLVALAGGIVVTPPAVAVSRSTVAPPATDCPSADPLAPARREVRNTISAPPAAATYRYRNDGRYEVSGAHPASGAFPARSTRTIRAGPDATDGSWTFDVVAELVGTTTTTTYHVVPTATAAQGAGLYVRRIDAVAGSIHETFTPIPELLTLPFPAVPGTTFTAAATDPRSRIAMTYDGTVGQTARVDACGQWVDAISVAQANGRIVSPSTNEQFTARYAIATQYGGISVLDVVAVQGTEGDATVSRRNTATIGELPREPGR